MRAEGPGDIPEIRRISESALERPNEADLVGALQLAAGTYLSLVADLAPGALDGRTGLVKYRPEFAEV